MVRYIFLLFWLISQETIAQNLVPNPGFEQSKKKPCLLLTSPTQNISEYFFDWVTPTGGTTDPWYFSDTLALNCPQNTKHIGIRPRTGTRCVGLYSNTVSRTSAEKNYREYIQVKLIQPLKIGQVYSVEVFCRLYPFSNTASNNLGFYFSKDPVSILETNPNQFGAILPYTPQVNEGQVILGQDWQKVSGCFVAKEAYLYLPIGNFFDDNHTISQALPVTNSFRPPYYLLDDVSVTPAGVASLPIVNLGKDTTLCPSQSLSFRLPTLLNVTYTWQDGSTGPVYTVWQNGTYTAEAQVAGCLVSDTVRVNVERAVSLPPDTILCRGETLTLQPDHPDWRYIWSDGSRDSTLRVNQAGAYSVRIPSVSCSLSDTIRVQVADCPGVVPNVFTPNGDDRNETFAIDNIELSPWGLRVYNRWGAFVYHSELYRNQWDSAGLASGTYYYELHSPVLKRSLKGWVELLR